MNRQSVVSVVVMATVVAVWGCAGTDAPPGPAGPTLSLLGANGIHAGVRRTVTEISGGTETVVSVADTTIWAPFDERGAAMPSSDEAGVPGPIGWLSYDSALPPEWSRYASFVDSTGLLHELWLTGKGRGLLETMLYRRGGAPALEYDGTWLDVTGGWLLATEALTFHPAEGPPVRLDVATQQANVARALPGADALFRTGAWFTGLLRPQPLEAQMYFQECSGDWLKWMGAAVLTELAWGKFIQTKRPADFKRALAATTAAGVALSALVDCMSEQPEQPDPGKLGGSVSFVWGLRIFTVVAMGWVVAHSARTILMSVGGHDRLTARALVGQALTGLGAFLIGWGLLPGGSASAETTMMIVGCLTWAIGATVEPVQRA